MAKYHRSASGKIAQCRAKGACPLGEASAHYDGATISKVAKRTYTPVKELTAQDVEQYLAQEKGLDAPFRGMEPGTDITDDFPVPLVNYWGPGAEGEPITSYFAVRKAVVVDEDKYFLLLETRSFITHNVVVGWLIQDKGQEQTPIGMIGLMEQQGSKYPYSVMSVEVRPEYRGQGLAKKIAFGANTVCDGQVYDEGHYTPAGHQRLQGLFKPTDPAETGPRGVSFRDMNFIKDWDNFTPP